MKKKFSRIIAFMMVALTAISAVGCSDSGGTSSVAQEGSSSAAASTAETSSEAPADGKIVSESLTLTYWSPISQKVSNFVTNYNELAPYIELEKRTGIHIEFQHPPVGQENEQLNIMLASNELPDLIYWNWSNLPGGAAKALTDNILVSLNDQLEANAPNLLALYEEYPDARVDSMLDDGTFYMMPFIKPDKTVRSVQGFQLRGDWLEKLGLESPETIDDWYEVLTAFKQQDPNGNGEQDEIPFTAMKNQNLSDLGLSQFAGAWGIILDFYVDDGKVHYGPAEPVYKEYLTEMRKWYEEGLIDSDFAIADQKQFDAKITTNEAGSFYGLASGNMGRYMNMLIEDQPEFSLNAVYWPETESGERYAIYSEMVRPIVGEGVGITSANEHVTESIKWCDYQYGEEGRLLMNFGIEGESYTMEDGEPVYTDVIFNNPDGLTPDQAVAKYATTFGASTIYDTRYYTQILVLPQQKEAIQIWADGDTSLILPSTTPTVEESSRLASITNEINTYASEMFNKFVMGQEPIENFDQYLEQIKNMGVDEAIEIQQAAYDRYLNRK